MSQAAQIKASLSPDSGPDSLKDFPVQIKNLSNAGVSMLVSSDIDEVMRGHDNVMLSMTLPGQSSRYTIACEVRRRDEVDGGTVYSCEYDWSATMDPLGVVEDILEFMMDNNPS